MIIKEPKNYKENVCFILINIQNGCSISVDCKQKDACWFQIINLSFTSCNSATFDAKVAEFFIENKWVRNSI